MSALIKTVEGNVLLKQHYKAESAVSQLFSQDAEYSEGNAVTDLKPRPQTKSNDDRLLTHKK